MFVYGVQRNWHCRRAERGAPSSRAQTRVFRSFYKSTAVRPQAPLCV